MEKMECSKEFKVRMPDLFCVKYKTLQPELLTKKFIFADERDSIHNLKLLRDDASEQNKATITTNYHKLEETTVEEQQQPEEQPEKVRKAMTGMFRDNIRRIDLVLVVEDDVNELMNNIKLDFLTYIVRAGLEVEIEPGVMKNHEHLTFIKIHAPDSILKKYGTFFGTKRYFADTRYDYMDEINYEKDWVMLVRNNYATPNGYSNYERSIIVYKMLLHLSFGEHANYYGIERLLKSKVILDVFALHDGPYFMTPEQTISGSNARQILNCYWSRIQNVFQQQPIHLIHEYFGPRVAFYFAFYEFFTKGLKVAAFVGIFSIVLGSINLTFYEKDISKALCASSNIMCSFCENQKICPRRIFKEYCLSAKIHLILDHLFVPIYSIFTVVGAFIFVRLWRRKEYLLKWIWEVGHFDSYYRIAVRPLFNNGFGEKTDPIIDGLKYRESIIKKIIRHVISKGIVMLYWFSILPIMCATYKQYEYFCERMIVNRPYEKYRDYIVMSMFQTVYTLIVTVAEKIYHYIVYFLVKYENHSTHKKFNDSIVIKKIGFEMVLQYALIAYYAWIHGHQLFYRGCALSKGTSLYFDYIYIIQPLLGQKCNFCNTFCSPYTCVIEISTLLATLLVVTQVIYKISKYIFNLRTDYNQSIYRDSDIPCWEREYRLSSRTEENILRKCVDLAAQFTLVTWFVTAFPLAPLILYLVNLWDIRHEARQLLLASRRPLLLKTPGIRMTKVFYFIASVAVLTNAMNIVLATRSRLRYVMNKLGKKPAELLDFNHYYRRHPKCYAPDLFKDGYNPVKDHNLYFRDGKFHMAFTSEYFWLVLYGYYQSILFVFLTIFAVFMICYAISRQSEVKKARLAEEKIRNLYYHYKYHYSKPR